jgi:arginine decarboxylase
METSWSIDAARNQYAIAHWGENYFDVDKHGRLIVRPRGVGGPALALQQIVDAANDRGSRLPLLVRFGDILRDRLARLQGAFAKAMADWEYEGGYTAAYPVKVNQQKAVVSELVSAGADGFGLEAGSKPELMAVLALARPGSIIICNGYKDREYLRLALIGRKLGLRVFIVIEKPSELKPALEEARALDVEPLFGVRMRLTSLGAGKWQNTGGEKSKFGLTPRQLITLIDELKAANLSRSLKLLHVFMGSQISNVRDIAAGMREATRYFVELCKLGIPIEYVDVGGGLGVDYEGTRSRSACSINYGLDQYAATVIQPLAEACAQNGFDHPHVISETGRAMVAHHAVLVVNVSDIEHAPLGRVPTADTNEPSVLHRLREIQSEVDSRAVIELYHEAQHHWTEGHALFSLGQLTLRQRARLDDLYYVIVNALRVRLKPEERSHRQALDELNEKLVDKYFVNFSIFESIPDTWAIDQIFPIVPIAGLDRVPDRRGVIADLTCDSDGRIDAYVDAEGVDVSLPLHAPREGESYRLGIFLVGAYQEALGDIHNLFGDTDAVNVRLKDDGGFEFSNIRRGDTTDVMLDYVGYDLAALRAAYREKIAAAGLTAASAETIATALEQGLTGYTYLAEHDET